MQFRSSRREDDGARIGAKRSGAPVNSFLFFGGSSASRQANRKCENVLRQFIKETAITERLLRVKLASSEQKVEELSDKNKSVYDENKKVLEH